MYSCPNCNTEIEEEICPNCGFDINTTLSCPYKISKKCVHNKQECPNYGLKYELCQIYLIKSGIGVK